MNAEQHILWARLHTGELVNFPGTLDWNDAIDKWYELDDARRAGRLPMVKFLEVRSALDPNPERRQALRTFFRPTSWQAVFRPTNGRTYSSRENAARAFVRQNDRYEGRPGGWIYRNGVAIVQGYFNFGKLLQDTGRLVSVVDGTKVKWTVAP